MLSSATRNRVCSSFSLWLRSPGVAEGIPIRMSADQRVHSDTWGSLKKESWKEDWTNQESAKGPHIDSSMLGICWRNASGNDCGPWSPAVAWPEHCPTTTWKIKFRKRNAKNKNLEMLGSHRGGFHEIAEYPSGATELDASGGPVQGSWCCPLQTLCKRDFSKCKALTQVDKIRV